MATISGTITEDRVLVPEAWGKAERPVPSGPSAVARGEAPNPEASPARAPRSPSPVEATAALLRGRYTALLIWRLFWGGKRFYQLVRELEGVPRKAIAHELEELERAGIVKRVVGRGPGKVEYRLTPSGDALKIVVGAMYEWGLLFRPPTTMPSPAAPRLSLDEASH
jgi:DNA-binding HxlR family transcriptional regulator